MEPKDAAPPEGNKPITSPPTSQTNSVLCVLKSSDARGNKLYTSPTIPPDLIKINYITPKSKITTTGKYILPNTPPNSPPDFILLDNFITETHCSSMINDIVSSKLLKQHCNIIKGQKVKQPRLSGWFSDIPYSFSGCTMAANKPNAIPSTLNICNEFMNINKQICEFKKKPNGHLINLYRNGNDKVAVHKDNESIIDKEQHMTCLSLGQTRLLNIHRTKTGPVICSIVLKSGSLLIMTKGFGEYYHNVPNDNSRYPRVSITHRVCHITKPILQIKDSGPHPPLSEIPKNIMTDPTSPPQNPSGKFWNSQKVNDEQPNPQQSVPSPQYQPTKTPLKPIKPNLLKNNTTFSPKHNPTNTIKPPPPTTPIIPHKKPTSQSKSINPLPSLLTLDTLLLCVDFMKKDTLKKECHTNNIPTSGGCATLRKRLHDHIKQSFRIANSSNDISPPSTAQSTSTQPGSTGDSQNTHILNSIKTLESSILDLSTDIKNQQKLLEGIIIAKDPKSKPDKNPQPLLDQLNVLDRRIESIEDTLATLKEQSSVSCTSLTTLQANTIKLLSSTKETLNYIKSPSTSTTSYIPTDHTPLDLPPPPPEILFPPDFPQPPSLDHFPTLPPTQTPHFKPTALPHTVNKQLTNHTESRNHQQKSTMQHKRSPMRPIKTPNSSARVNQKLRKTVIICDSQLRGFNTNFFMKSFETQTIPIFTYESFISNGYRRVLQIPAVDCYVIELGVNDLKKCTSGSPNSYHRVTKMAEESIRKLLESSPTAKICVSLPTPTPNNVLLNNFISRFNKDMNNWVSERRNTNLSDARMRLYTINNSNFGKFESDGSACPFKADMLHLNDYGLRKLAINMKFGVYRAFGWKYTYTPKPHGNGDS